ncbi:MAG: chalcone isomerase family protein [Desulfobacterales bacterium]|nr:MAG: chalcone isomerase family protein [Desulfobacterales bacterium]
MKNFSYIITIFALLVFVGSTPNVNAAEIEGIQFADTYQTEGIRLKIQGTGLLRYLGVIKAYVGALYLEEGSSIKDVLADKPKRLEVEYFHALKGEDFGITTNKVIAKNTDSQTLQSIRPQIDYHNSLYEDVQPGDRYSLTYVPGKGTTLALNGKSKGIIEGADFASALFSMWLGKFPMNKPFKKQLLGLK